MQCVILFYVNVSLQNLSIGLLQNLNRKLLDPGRIHTTTPKAPGPEFLVYLVIIDQLLLDHLHGVDALRFL